MAPAASWRRKRAGHKSQSSAVATGLLKAARSLWCHLLDRHKDTVFLAIMFGVIVEGYPPATNFNQVEEARFLLADPVPHGSSLKRLTFFLTAVPAPIPDGLVASVYVSMFPHEQWRCLGYVSNSEPSKILNVDWPESDVQDQPPEVCPLLPVCLSTYAHQTCVGALACVGALPDRCYNRGSTCRCPRRRCPSGAARGVWEEDRAGPHDLHGIV